MARTLMPKSGVVMPYVVVNRDAAVVGVQKIDNRAGSIDLTADLGYIKESVADGKYAAKADSYTKTEVDAAHAKFLANDDALLNYGTPLQSHDAHNTGTGKIDLIKAETFTNPSDNTTSENNIVIGDLDSGIQGVHIFSEGRVDIVYKNDANQTVSAPLYSKRYRPETEDMPFAVVGEYVRDGSGRVISVNKTGVNSDITSLTNLATIQEGTAGSTLEIGKATQFNKDITVNETVHAHAISVDNLTSNITANFSGKVYVPAGTSGTEAVNFAQMNAAIAQSGGGGGGVGSGYMSSFLGSVEWLNGSEGGVPAGYLAASGQIVNRADYPELWSAIEKGLLNSIDDTGWLNIAGGNHVHRSKFSTGDGSTTFRLPDLNGKVAGSASGIFLGGPSDGIPGYSSKSSGVTYIQSAPNITGSASNQGAAAFPATGYAADSALQPGPNHPSQLQPATGSGANGIHLNASLSDGTYGRDGKWLYPNHAVGVWIIRVSGLMQTGSTSVEIKKTDATPPANATLATGGVLVSKYEGMNVGTTKATFSTNHVVGTKASAAEITVDATGISGQSKSFRFDSNGDFFVPGQVNASSLELKYDTPFIDFHSQNSTTDYTYRMICESDSILRFTGSGDNANVWFDKGLVFSSRGAANQGIYMHSDPVPGGNLMYVADVGGGVVRHGVIGGYVTRKGSLGTWGGNGEGNLFNFDWGGAQAGAGVATQTGGGDGHNHWIQAVQPFDVWVDSTFIGRLAFATTSDKHLKTDITYHTDAIKALEEVNQWKVADFTYKSRGEHSPERKGFGFIAQELREVSPEVVRGIGIEDGEDITDPEVAKRALELDEVSLIAKLTQAVQALTKRVEELEKANG